MIQLWEPTPGAALPPMLLGYSTFGVVTRLCAGDSVVHNGEQMVSHAQSACTWGRPSALNPCRASASAHVSQHCQPDPCLDDTIAWGLHGCCLAPSSRAADQPTHLSRTPASSVQHLWGL